MRILFILAFIANLLVTLISLVVLPERVAIHFGADGIADGWASTYVNAVLMTSVHVLIFCTFYFLPRLLFLIPARWINLPNKDYWLQPENLPQTQKTFSHLMWQFGIAMFLFLLIVGLLSLQANLSSPVRLNLTIFYPALVIFLIYTIWWTIGMYRAFRLPPTA